MRRTVLLDTGPLVALLNRRDRHHAWSAERFGEIEPPLLTCEAVLAEACFLLRQQTGGPSAVLQLVRNGVLRLPMRLEDEAAAIERLMTKYSDVPMALADACLVRMAEMDTGSLVLTVDGDFGIYRRNGRQTIPILMPPEPR